MSKEICHRDQCKLNQIFVQVEALSDVVDELRTELNNLKKISLNVNRDNVFFESTNGNNKVDCVRLSVLEKVKTYVRNIGASTRTDGTCQFAKDTQNYRSYLTFSNHATRSKRKRDEKPSAIRFSTIYGGLKLFKNKIFKNTQSIKETQRSLKSTKQKCMTSNQQQQECLLQRKIKQKSYKLDIRDKDTKCTDVSKELCNSADTLFTSDASVQAEIAMCSWQEDDERSFNCNYFPCRNITENSVQVSSLSMINDDQSVIYSDRFIDELSKRHAKQAFLRNKIKRYKKCSCRGECPYALYKLPCNKYRCSTPEKKVDDEVNGLTLECLSFKRENNFPKFINVDMIREKSGKRRFMDLSPVEIGMDESSISSLSVDLEVNVCNDYCNSENIDEFTKRRKARTYVVNKTSTGKDDLIKNFRIENESSFNIISSWRNVSENKEKIDKIVKNTLSQRKYINPEENQGYKKSRMGSFIGSHWPIKNNNRQVQYAIPAPTSPVSNKKISVKTSTPNFQRNDILNQLCRATNKRRCVCTNFSKIITPRRMTTDIQTQASKCLYFNYLKNKSALDDYKDGKNAKVDEDGEKQIARRKNVRDICVIERDASPSQIIWPRTKRYNIYSVLQTEEDVNVHSKEPLRQTCDLNDWQNRIMPTREYPYYRNCVEERKNLMPYPTDYHPSSKTLSFDMSNVSGRLYGCLEKLEDITT